MRRPHLFVPHHFLTPKSAQSVCDRPTGSNVVYFPCVHAALVRLVGSSFPQSQRGDSSRSRGREDGLSFQTSTLSTPAIYRASLMGDQAMMKRRLGAVN
jgi:hypothetical protein